MHSLLKSLKPVSYKWKDLARFLKVNDVKTIEKDCNYNSTSDDALKEVVTRWCTRTTKAKRTWKTLSDAVLEEDDYSLQQYIKENQLSCKFYDFLLANYMHYS